MKKELYEPLAKKIYDSGIEKWSNGINLEDVLQVIFKLENRGGVISVEDYAGYTEIYINFQSGKFYVNCDDGNLDLCTWEYGKPLVEQSNELGQFLTDILI